MNSAIKPQGALRPVIIAWLLAGTLDGAAAVIQFLIISGGGNPIRVFQYIASGVFGRAAFDTQAMAFWGIAFHYFIALCWTLFFFLLYPKVSLLRRNTPATVAAYGVLVWMVMNLIVLPISNVPLGQFNLTRAIVGALILIVCVALPVIVVTRKHYATQIDVHGERNSPGD